MKNMIYLLVPFLLVSCAHTFMRGTVAKKVSKDQAIVCLGDNEVKLGDNVKFEQSMCNNISRSNNITMHEMSNVGSVVDHTGYGQTNCELIYLGRGKVEKIINSHFSLVKIDGDIDFDEKTQVEVLNE